MHWDFNNRIRSVRISAKFRFGVIHIIPLLVLTVLPVLMVAGVFYLQSNVGNKKIDAASGDPSINAPTELTCSGQFKTIKSLGKSRVQAMASYNNRLIIVDYQPFPGDSSTKFYLRAREVNPETSLDTGWYENGLKDSQASVVMKEEGGKLNLYAYGHSGGDNRNIVKGNYVSEKRWSGFTPFKNHNLGITGPYTASLNGKVYRIIDSLPDNRLDPALADSNGYLQECVPGVAVENCWFWPTPAVTGGSNSMIRVDGIYSSRPVNIVVDGVYVPVGSSGYATSTGWNSGNFNIPSTVGSGRYKMVVGNNPGILCKHPSGQEFIEVIGDSAIASPAPTPSACPTLLALYDMNDDGVIDQKDVDEVNGHFGEEGEGLKWDVNFDGVVDLSDSLLVAGQIGKGC